MGKILARTPVLLALLVVTVTCTREKGPPPPRAIVFVIDTLRCDSLGCYEHSGNPTPRIDEIAAQGTVFEQAISSSASAMTWILPKQEPSLSSKKLNPAFESRRVRTQPSSTISRPTFSALRASATESFSGMALSSNTAYLRAMYKKNEEERSGTGVSPV